MKKAVRRKRETRLPDAGSELDRRARLVMEKKSVSYREALSLVIKKSPKLARDYNKPRERDSLLDLRSLCDSLEQETQLATILLKLLCPRAYDKAAVVVAANTLADMMSKLQTNFLSDRERQELYLCYRVPT